MQVCKTCRSAVLWIVTAAGRKMPLDPVPFSIVLDPEAGEVAVTEAGETVRGRRADPWDEGAISVRTSHFATCPQSAQHRKPKE